MRSARLAAFAALSSLAFFPSVAQASSCWLPKEAEAAQVRGLHLMLMAGTLQCRASHPESVDLFNDFVEDQRSVLIENTEALKSHFLRESGERWRKDSDTFETSLANLYSARLDDGGYCGVVSHFARLATGASRDDLLLLARSVADAPVSGVCRPADEVHAAGFGRVEGTRLPPKVALSDALRARAEPLQAVEAAPATVPAVVAVAEAPAEAEAPTAERLEAPTVQLAQAEVPAAQEAQAAPPQAAASSKEEVLKAAVAALQSAVVALQAVSAPAEQVKAD